MLVGMNSVLHSRQKAVYGAWQGARSPGDGYLLPAEVSQNLSRPTIRKAHFLNLPVCIGKFEKRSMHVGVKAPDELRVSRLSPTISLFWHTF